MNNEDKYKKNFCQENYRNDETHNIQNPDLKNTRLSPTYRIAKQKASKLSSLSHFNNMAEPKGLQIVELITFQ